jgi:hypothetical protein
MFLTPSQRKANKISDANVAMTALLSVANKGNCFPLCRDEYIAKCIEAAGQGYNKYNAVIMFLNDNNINANYKTIPEVQEELDHGIQLLNNYNNY